MFFAGHHTVVLTSTIRASLSPSRTISFPEAAILLVSRRGSRPLARSNSGSPRFTDFPSLCACSESSLTNLIGSGLNQLCLHGHSKPECRWAWPGVPIFPAHDKRDPWGRGCMQDVAVCTTHAFWCRNCSRFLSPLGGRAFFSLERLMALTSS